MKPYASDRRLVRKLIGGDEQAFEEFFESYFPALYRFALVRCAGDADAAEEISQATLCKAISKLSTYRGEAMLFTWLCTFCRHEISAHFRRLGRQPRPLHLEEDNPEIAAALDTLSELAADGPEQALQRGDVRRLVQTTLDRLPRRYGDALEWKYAEGLSVKEIAGRLGLRPKAAESLLTRAREAFRDGFTTLTRVRPLRGASTHQGS
jgi:RNA polymerase sigma-70 factor (ECF subfamily)